MGKQRQFVRASDEGPHHGPSCSKPAHPGRWPQRAPNLERCRKPRYRSCREKFALEPLTYLTMGCFGNDDRAGHGNMPQFGSESGASPTSDIRWRTFHSPATTTMPVAMPVHDCRDEPSPREDAGLRQRSKSPPDRAFSGVLARVGEPKQASRQSPAERISARQPPTQRATQSL